MYQNADVHFYSGKGIDYSQFKHSSDNSDLEFCVCLEALSVYPSLVQSLYSRMSSKEDGFFVTYYYDQGYWHEQVLDDWISYQHVDKSSLRTKDFSFIEPNARAMGPCLLEKSWAKKQGCYTKFMETTHLDPGWQ